MPQDQRKYRGLVMIVGYTTGVFDLFHIGHLNVLRSAKSLCDKLIVGVTTDKLVAYKNRKVIIPFNERVEIVRNLRCVDTVIPQESMDKFGAWKRLKFDIMFVGDDWYESKEWLAYEKELKEVGVKIVYFPYTKGISSTIISKLIEKANAE